MDNNEIKKDSPYGTVKIKNLKGAIRQIEKYYKSQGLHPETAEITFEFLIGSFFPEIIKNIEEKINKERTAAFIEGVNSVKEKYGTTD
jgi:hypothetical protein